MSFIFATLALISTFAPILEEEATAAAEAGSAMGSSIWIVLMILAVVLVGAVWYVTNRIQPPSSHADAHGSAHADSH